jgi:uncharacterized membrane protein
MAISGSDGTTNVEGKDIFKTSTNIILAGYYQDTAGNLSAATWGSLDTRPEVLTSNTSVANSIYKSGADLHIVGFETIGSFNVATYWKNFVATRLYSQTVNSKASAVAVSDNDVYIAGNITNSSGNLEAKYWKNGNMISLADPSKRSEATAIFIVKN